LYGDYGIFDVNLNVPNNYITEATGKLMNQDEVLPAALLEKLQIKNFATKPWNETPSTIIEYKKGERKTWKYHAENVHDFAFTTDPSYRVAYTKMYDVQCVAICQEPHCSKWQNGSAYISKIIKTFSDDFGMYEYPKIVAADANDGMEYPMITLCGGADPGYRGLLVHEIGHNWFYGMIGNNETYRAALDEGFTQFITAWGLQKIDGDFEVADKNPKPYVQKHKEPINVWDKSFLYRYTNDATRGDDKCLNTHSNDFNSALAHENGYGNVYHKTATMLLNLQYVLGDTLFSNAMKHYVEKYKFAHPYFADFREAIIEYTHVDLNWYFDQWLETTKTIDYKVKGINKHKNNNYAITLQRDGEMQMPLDVTIVAKNGTRYDYHIPNTNWFNKNTTATILPKWYGWDKMNSTYTFETQIPSGINYVQIDTSGRMADVDLFNNYRSAGFNAHQGTDVKMDYGVSNYANRHKQDFYVRPDVWWNPYNGVKMGVHIESNYMNYLRKMSASIWWNTTFLSGINFDKNLKYKTSSPLDYNFNFETPIKKISKKLFFGLQLRSLEGLARNSISATWKPNVMNSFKAEATVLDRRIDALNNNYWGEWSSYIDFNNANNNYAMNKYVQLSWLHNYRDYKSNGMYKFTLRNNLPNNNTLANYNYAYLQFELVHKNYWKKFDISSRIFARIGSGNSLPYESSLFLAGANPEEMAESKFTRTSFYNNTIFNDMNANGFSMLQSGGGLNLRGYTGYIAIDKNATTNDIYLNYKGRGGISASTEIEFDKYIKFAPKFTRNWLHADAYLFGDAGAMERSLYDFSNYSNLQIINGIGLSKLRADAGIGAAFTIKNWGKFEKAEPLTLRVDCPILLTSVPAGYLYNNISLRRFVVGINRCF
jgi:hypothetical protein